MVDNVYPSLRGWASDDHPVVGIGRRRSQLGSRVVGHPKSHPVEMLQFFVVRELQHWDVSTL